MLVRKGGRHNPAFINPQDLASLGLVSGDAVELSSPYGVIPALVEEDGTLRRGVVSMSHSFGDLPALGADFRVEGSNTNELTSVEHSFDRYTGIPRMSAVPVRIHVLKTA